MISSFGFGGLVFYLLPIPQFQFLPSEYQNATKGKTGRQPPLEEKVGQN